MGYFVKDSTKPASSAQSAPTYDHKEAVAEESGRGQSRYANPGYVLLEIRRDTLYELIHKKWVVIEDLRGLDMDAKRGIERMLLESLRL